MKLAALTFEPYPNLTTRQAPALFGVLIFASIVTRIDLTFAYYALKWLRRKCRNILSTAELRKPANIWKCILPVLHRWANVLERRPLRNVSPCIGKPLNVYSDASLQGWGGVCLDSCPRVFIGRWSAQEKMRHINELEVCAVLRVLQASQLRNCNVVLHIDNTTAIAALSKQRAYSYWTNCHLGEVLECAREQNIRIIDIFFVCTWHRKKT